LALSVPLSRFTSQVGGGSAFFVRRQTTLMNLRATFGGRWVRRFSLFLVVYGFLWLVTWFFGVSQTRNAGLRELGDISAGWSDISRGRSPSTRSPWYYCRASAYGPFLVRVDYGWVSDPMTGDGGSVWYFWLFGRAFRVHEFDHWMV
jgi:hypothetical protein